MKLHIKFIKIVKIIVFSSLEITPSFVAFITCFSFSWLLRPLTVSACPKLALAVLDQFCCDATIAPANWNVLCLGSCAASGIRIF